MAVTSFPWDSVNSLVQSVIEKTIRDQVFLSNAGLYEIRKNKKTKTGGRTWAFPLNWKVEGNGGGFFSGLKRLDTTVYDTITMAEFTPKNAYVPLAVSWEDTMIVAGPEEVRDLVSSRSEIARNTALDLLANNVYNSGTDAEAITGLQYIFGDWASATTFTSQMYGGTTRAVTGVTGTGLTGTNVWWAHQGDVTAYTCDPLTGTLTANNLQALGTAFARVKLLSGKWPNLILSNVYSWTAYHNALVKNERLQRPQQSSELGKAGFRNLMYRDAAWVADEKAPRSSSKIEKIYFLNTDTLQYCVDPRADLTWTGWRNPHDQMAQVGFFLNRAEMYCIEPRANLVMSAVDTSAIS